MIADGAAGLAHYQGWLTQSPDFVAAISLFNSLIEHAFQAANSAGVTHVSHDG